MAINLALYDYADEDYIDMELSSSPPNILCCSPPQSREFEFKMSSTCYEKETTTSPADELFYKGKLLPLHLPPRRQMVENLLHSSSTTTTTTTSDISKEAFEEDHYYITFSTAPCTKTTNTPLNSCNISPSESCRVSCELNPDDHLFNWSTELSSFINNHPTKKSWSKKLKLIKHSFLRQKLKASRAYLKSLFIKSVCSDDSSAKANYKAGVENLPIGEASSSKYLNIGNKIPLGHISRASYPNVDTIMKNIKDKEGIEDNVHRRSFSGAIKRHSPTKCLSSSSSDSSSGASSQSSSFSFNSNGLQEPHFLRRSSSVTEIEMSIDAAIAHCKKSQQIFHSRNSTRDSGICSLSASRIEDGEDQKRPGLCRI